MGSDRFLPLMGVCLYGDAKNYVVPKFIEMFDACCKGLVDIIVVGDRDIGSFERIPSTSPGIYSEDMLIVGREVIRQEALKRHSPCFIWQGVDCLYQSREDFEKLLRAAQEYEAPVGALTSARSHSDYAVARRFTDTAGRQELIDHGELRAAIAADAVIPAGFPGADALVIPWGHYIFDFGDHLPWYTRLAQGTPELCAEEFWCLKLKRAGLKVWLHCGVRTWHVHEDNMAHMWPDIDKPLGELSWQ